MNVEELKKAEETVKALRSYASDCGDEDACRQCTFAWICDELDGNAPKIIADLIDSLTAQLAEVTKIRNDYATAAREIALWLNDFCNKSLPYDKMIADAARKASDTLAASQRREKAAVKELERLMKGLGGQCCVLCENKNSDCGFSTMFPCSSCNPKWHNPQEDEQGETE